MRGAMILMAAACTVLVGCEPAADESAPAPTPADSGSVVGSEMGPAGPGTPTADGPTAGAPADGAAGAAGEITDAARSIAQRYLDQLDALLGQVAGVQGLGDVAAQSGPIGEAVAQINVIWAEFGELAPETQQQLITLFDSRFTELKTRLDAEVSRLKQNATLAPIASYLERLRFPGEG